MATEICVPMLDESATEATIGRWFKKTGDAFAWAGARLGKIAFEAARLVEESVAATAMIEARNDRIERLNADKCRALNEMIKG